LVSVPHWRLRWRWRPQSTDGATAVASIVPYRIVFKLHSGCRLSGSLWSVVLGCGCSSHHVRCVTGRGCVEDGVPVDRMSMNEHVEDKSAHGVPIPGVRRAELSVGDVRSWGTIVRVRILTDSTVQYSAPKPYRKA
jgi:hypothetical protein